MITKAIGAEPTVEPDYFTFRTEDGDCIILCSDGMYNEVGENEIVRMAGEYEEPAALAEALVSRANEDGGSDNITVVAIRVA